jgi:hypothetical protein
MLEVQASSCQPSLSSFFDRLVEKTQRERRKTPFEMFSILSRYLQKQRKVEKGERLSERGFLFLLRAVRRIKTGDVSLVK